MSDEPIFFIVLNGKPWDKTFCNIIKISKGVAGVAYQCLSQLPNGQVIERFYLWAL